MYNVSPFPILHQPRGRQYELSLLDNEKNTPITGKGQPKPKIKVTKRIIIQPGTQTWVDVVAKQNGLVLVDLDLKIFTNKTCLVVTIIANVTGDNPFKVVLANFG